jgi:hypothetical protein
MVLVVALLFVLLFAHALMSRARGHDALAGEVSLVFGAVTGIFITGVTNVLFDTDRPPVFVEALASALILVVPLLTLRLVSRFRSLPSWLLPTAVVLYVAGSGTVVYLLAGLQPGADLPQWAAWFALAGFVATEAAATYYFWGEAGDRQGAARLRLRVAAMATALFAASMLSTQFSRPLVSQVLALVSAVGYVAAFMPPRRVLATSSMAAAHRYGRDLLTGPSQPTAEQVWKRFAVAVRELTESDAVVILSRTSNGETTTLTAAGIDLAGEQVRESVDFERLNKLSRQRRVNVQCPVESRLAARVDAEYATLIPLPPPYEGMSAHVAMLLSQHRSLFSGDDLAVIRDLGAQAALLSGRAESAYEQRRLANELGETVDALHVASRAKSDLLARVSHEFRTPLTAIIGYSALLRRSMEGGDPMLAQTGPDRIYSAGLHLLALVEEVLDVAQMDAGHLRTSSLPTWGPAPSRSCGLWPAASGSRCAPSCRPGPCRSTPSGCTRCSTTWCPTRSGSPPPAARCA